MKKIDCDELEIVNSSLKDHINIWQADEFILLSKDGAKELIEFLKEWIE